MRRIHSFFGLGALVFISFMAITGALLSLQPAIDAVTSAPSAAGQTVAELAAKVSATLPGVERVTRSASGQVVAYYSDTGARLSAVVDPASGAVIAPYQPSGFFTFLTELHRSLFLGANGHIVSGIAAIAMVILALSGLLVLVHRMGGWRYLLQPARGTLSQRWHTDLARIGMVALCITALSGAYMSAVNFGFVGDGEATGFSLPVSGSGATPAPIGTLEGLAESSIRDLRELVFPAVGDTSDVFTLTTHQGLGYIDQATGEILKFTANSGLKQLYEAIYMLHTGDGIWWLGLVLGLMALCVPALGVTGVVIWARRRANTPKIRDNVRAPDADTVILVGSEGGSTWGFAETLHRALTEAGRKVHVAAMNDIGPHYAKATRMLVLTATYGEGTAPASAGKFLARVGKFDKAPVEEIAVLGFGDRNFPHFCGFAEDVEAALTAIGARTIVPYTTIDRQSPQDFAAWGRALGQQMHHPVELMHVPRHPKTIGLELIARDDYGIEVQAPTVVLRFAVPRRRLGTFTAGDLVGIVPPGSTLPRFYSLASGSKDGVLEICVRKFTGGLCSEFLHGLEPGQTVEAFIRPNPDFRPNHGSKPVILVGAGAGVAPLVGFVRANHRHRPMHLLLGVRDAQSDFLYGAEMVAARRDGRLTSLQPVFSRAAGGGYVQDRIRDQADAVRDLIASGAQILVCGSRDMASGVREAIDECLAPLGLSSDDLKQKGRYLEDAY
jgi:sulfite reductase (NADPH) flavoprotein alpha-component